jgi:hypothetical protein
LLSVGRGSRFTRVLSVFGTGFYSYYLWGEGSRCTSVLSVFGSGQRWAKLNWNLLLCIKTLTL